MIQPMLRLVIIAFLMIVAGCVAVWWFLLVTLSPISGGRVTGWAHIGFALAFIATAAYPVWTFAKSTHDSRQRMKRKVANQCTGCGYDLTGNISGTCPECGQDRLNKRMDRT